MSPKEVQGLQALAHANGGSLTTNPHTGLPEAGFLDKLMPTIIGAGLAYMTGGMSLGADIGMASLSNAAVIGGGVGLVEAARTGDIGKGLMAGLGAYGGAGLTSGVMNAGANALSGEATSAAAQQAANAAGEEATKAGLSDAARQQAIEEAGNATARVTPNASAYEKLSAGAESASNNPMRFLKENAKPLMYAAGPAILAAANTKNNMPQTVTQPGKITPYGYDPYSGTYTAASPYETVAKKAAGGGLMNGASDSGSGGMFDFTKDGSNEPVVRSMADGGVAHFDGTEGSVVSSDSGYTSYTPEQIKSYFAANPGADVNGAITQFHADPAAVAAAGFVPAGLAALDRSITGSATATPAQAGQVAMDRTTAAAAAAANPYTSYTNDQYSTFFNDPKNAAVLNTPGGLAAAISQYHADPTAVNSYLQQNASALGLSGGDIYNIKAGQGIQGVYDAADKWVAANPNANSAQIADAIKSAGLSTKDVQNYFNRPNEAFGKNAATGKAFTAASDLWAALAPGKEQGGEGGLKQLNYTITDWVAKHPTATLADAQNAMSAAGVNELDVIRATGKSSAQLYTKAKEDVITGKVPEIPTPTASVTAPVIKGDSLSTTSNVTAPTSISTADKSALPVGVSGAGITNINPNGTITTRPDLNLNLKDVRDKYTTGGGSLGYIPYTPKTLDEFNAKYANTGGSKQSLDYLTGKTAYSPTPYTPTGEVMKPYSESVLGVPIASSKKMYLFDPTTKQYKINPDYAIPTYDATGKKSYSVTNKEVADYVATKPSSTDLYTWMTTNNLSPEQVAQASGAPVTDIYKKFSSAKALTDSTGKIDPTKVSDQAATDEQSNFDAAAYLKANPDVQAELDSGKANFGTKDDPAAAAWAHYQRYGKAENRAYTKKAAEGGLAALTMARGGATHQPFFSKSTGKFSQQPPQVYADGGIAQFNLGGYSDGGRLLRGPGDGVSDSIPATIANKRPARLADGEFVVPARIVSELGNGSTEAGARQLYAMMDRVQAARKGSIGKGKVANNSRADKYLPA
jgi:hypothetical protein